MRSIARTLPPDYKDPRLLEGAWLRRIIRLGAYDGHTRHLAAGKLQVGLVVVPAAYAREFQQFCLRNPKACPLVAVSRIGSPFIPVLGDVDLRTDMPRYDVYRYGELIRQQTDIIDNWREDFAALAIGSSPTFETALTEKGVVLRRGAEGKCAPMFRTLIRTARVGPFGGDMVVSMRPIRSDQVDTVRAVTARFPHAHGAPVHVGDPRAIGVDIAMPDWGDPLEIHDGEVPVFWASGITAQVALASARLEISITHAPGHLLVTDVPARADVHA